MTISLATLISRIKAKYNAENDTFFSDNFMYTHVNEAEGELALKGYVIEKTVTTTSTADTRQISYPTNLLALKELRYDYELLKKVELRNDPKTSSTDSTGTPDSYTVWDNIIYLYPTPSTTGDTIELKGYFYPSDKTSMTDTLEVPNEYVNAISNYVLAHMALKDINTTLYSAYMSEWKEQLFKVEKERRKRLRTDSPVIVSDEYFDQYYDVSDYYGA